MAIISVSGGDKLQDFLNAVVKKNGSDQEVSVGFMDGATYPDGTSVPMIAALQNYGTKGIPPRPFFSNMVKSKKSGWGKSLGEVLKENDFDGEEALKAMGEGIGAQLRQSIISTNSPALSPVTVMLRGMRSKGAVITGKTVGEAAKRVADGKTNYGASTKPLTDTAVMLNSIQYEVADGRYNLKDGS